jgi:flagellar biosynthesis/type III secretory pathway chaperone
MLSALEKENRALADGNPEALKAAGGDKARLVESLESLENERRSLVQALEIELLPGSDSSTDARWQQLLALIEECQRRNQRNGALVKARREQVIQALRILRGTQLELYDATGLTPGAAAVRPLGSA